MSVSIAATTAAAQADESAIIGSIRKSETAEALVADWRPSTDSEQYVTVHWPAAHGFYALPDGTYSPLLFGESVRQAALVLTHTVFDIPLSHRMSWQYLRSTSDPAALHRTGGDSTVELRMRHTHVKRRAGGTIHLTTQVTAVREGRDLGTAELRYSAYPPAIYDRLRGSHADAQQVFDHALPLSPALPPAAVGRVTERDVVLSAGRPPHHWRLRADTTHRVLFDHAHDHIPGMVLLEAASQAAHACAAPRRVVPFDFEATFFRYVELDQPCWITATPLDCGDGGHGRIRVDGYQGDAPAFSVTTESAAV
ncbi:ScbA/BarX family gamma-butyrolactone biosynthesis protein (plasmid) [Streptomyces sp. CG4]|uniref:ScbA/BarX family gamma-butyrolactone biosynthesis protein n=1 Tax=unclassified Streptomyces TaxID=2593676 RepID=UPI00332F5321